MNNKEIEILQETLYLEKTLNNLLLNNVLYNEGLKEIKDAIVKFISNVINFIKEKVKAVIGFIKRLLGIKPKEKKENDNQENNDNDNELTEKKSDNVKVKVPKTPNWIRKITHSYLTGGYIAKTIYSSSNAEEKFYSGVISSVKNDVQNIINSTKIVDSKQALSEAEAFQKNAKEFNSSCDKMEKYCDKLKKGFENAKEDPNYATRVKNCRLCLTFIMQLVSVTVVGIRACTSMYEAI